MTQLHSCVVESGRFDNHDRARRRIAPLLTALLGAVGLVAMAQSRVAWP